MTNHPREDGLLEWVKEQVEAAELYARAYPEHRLICRSFEDRAAAFRAVQREIESRGPLLDVGEINEGCLSCGQIIMEADEGTCGCDLSGDEKRRVRLTIIQPEEEAA